MIESNFKNSLSKLKIVYIEDDSDIRDYIEEFLRRYCNDIYTTSTAEEGLELYKRVKPDFIIVDINLSGMNGIEFIKLVRQEDKRTRIVISTAYTNKEFTLEAIELNLTRYLVKPITSEDLFLVLKKVISELIDMENRYNDVDLGNGFSFNNTTNLLQKNDTIIYLRKKELELLKFFISKGNNIITYEMLENEIWSDNVMTQDAIRGQIKNLRKKTHTKLFLNVSGVGYKIYKA